LIIGYAILITMVIRYLGHASFLIKAKEATIITDPFDPDKVGFSFPKVSADLVLSTHDHFDHNNIEAVGPARNASRSEAGGGEPFVVRGPGEYEVSGVKVWGFPSFHDNKSGAERGKNTIYLLEAEGLIVCHLGDLGHLLDEKTAEEIGSPDILLIPTGGVYTIDHEEAAKVAAQLEPKIIIPMHYKVVGMTESFKELSEVSAFLEEMGLPAGKAGVTGVEEQDKLTVTKTSLPEEPEVVVLKHG
jgi:L-ascorbate metabolism protein UlaG (beta-lactamase superfamily)